MRPFLGQGVGCLAALESRIVGAVMFVVSPARSVALKLTPTVAESVCVELSCKPIPLPFLLDSALLLPVPFGEWLLLVAGPMLESCQDPSATHLPSDVARIFPALTKGGLFDLGRVRRTASRTCRADPEVSRNRCPRHLLRPPQSSSNHLQHQCFLQTPRNHAPASPEQGAWLFPLRTDGFHLSGPPGGCARQAYCRKGRCSSKLDLRNMRHRKRVGSRLGPAWKRATRFETQMISNELWPLHSPPLRASVRGLPKLPANLLVAGGAFLLQTVRAKLPLGASLPAEVLNTFIFQVAMTGRVSPCPAPMAHTLKRTTPILLAHCL